VYCTAWYRSLTADDDKKTLVKALSAFFKPPGKNVPGPSTNVVGKAWPAISRAAGKELAGQWLCPTMQAKQIWQAIVQEHEELQADNPVKADRAEQLLSSVPLEDLMVSGPTM
jgi:hypothetical protein